MVPIPVWPKIANFNSAKTFKITNSQTLISANISSFTVMFFFQESCYNALDAELLDNFVGDSATDIERLNTELTLGFVHNNDFEI